MTANPSLARIHAHIHEHCPQSDWKLFLDAFFFQCRVNNLSEKTVTVYAERLLYLARYLSERGIDVGDVTKRTIQEYVVHLQGTVSDSTVNGRVRVFRCFWNYLCEDGVWESPNPCHKVKLIREESKIKPVVTPEQYASVLRRIDRDTFEGFRNYTMMMVMWDSMIRRGELLTLLTDNVDLQAGLLKVMGKGRKERWVPVGPRTLQVLRKYLRSHRRELPGDVLFCSRLGCPLEADYVQKLVTRLGEKSGIRLYPHLIRHSAATSFIRHGGSSAVLQVRIRELFEVQDLLTSYSGIYR
jgi:integrase/recombinase XerD